MTNANTIPMDWHPKFRKTESGCPLCGRALKSATKFIHVAGGGSVIVAAHLADDAVDGDMGWFEVGSGCANKLGPSWSKKLQPVTL